MRFNPSLLIALVALQINFAFGDNSDAVYQYNISVVVRDLTTSQRIPNVPVTLFRLKDDDWIIVSRGKTVATGGLNLSSTKYKYTTGTYKLRYDVRNHYNVTFYPLIDITFDVSSVLIDYPFPVLLDKYGYSTYKGVSN